jgi:L-2-hydroxyglutarate oxidase
MKNSLCRSGYLRLVQKYCPSLTLTLLTMCAPIGIADVAAGDGALQVWMERAVVTKRKSSISLPCGDTACARTPAPGRPLRAARSVETLHAAFTR